MLLRHLPKMIITILLQKSNSQLRWVQKLEEMILVLAVAEKNTRHVMEETPINLIFD
jgi:hypothetical protein